MYNSFSGRKNRIFEEKIFFFEFLNFCIEGSPLWIFLLTFDIFKKKLKIWKTASLGQVWHGMAQPLGLKICPAQICKKLSQVNWGNFCQYLPKIKLFKAKNQNLTSIFWRNRLGKILVKISKILHIFPLFLYHTYKGIWKWKLF